jgi:hypothetical protein
LLHRRLMQAYANRSTKAAGRIVGNLDRSLAA